MRMDSIIAQILDEFRRIVREELGISSNELLTPEELAEKLKVPVSWVYENSRVGKIPSIKVGRYVRFKLNDVLKSQRKEN
jgi:excisionase family DNA binding protein